MDDEDSYFDDMEGEEEDDDDDSADCFDEPAVEQHQAAYSVLDGPTCHAMATKQVVEVAEILACDMDVAQVLLRHFKWDQEKLTDEYMTDPEKTAAKVGIHMGSDASIVHQPSGEVKVAGVSKLLSSLTPINCLICFEPKPLYSALACGHSYCNECYKEYISHKIADEGHDCVYARCPKEKCTLLVSQALVSSVLEDTDKLQKFDRAISLSRSFVDDNPGLRWCTAADCGRAVKARPGVFGVECTCGERFCFQCGHEDHSPCSCDELKRWLVKCKDDSETFNWLVANTKACPKCGTSIEKNGGCNHMTCKNGACKYEFCWVCVGPWKDHSGSFYACNKYDPDKDRDNPDAKKKDSSRAALERYLHYYTRFTNHDNSLKLEMDARVNMENKVKEMEQLGSNTWIDCQYLTDANKALHECRYALKFTYVYAFYLPEKHNFRVRFEMQQMELERQTEELAEMLEKPVAEIDRKEVVNAFNMAKKRLKHLFEIVEQRYADEENGAGSSSSSAMIE